jgi:YidC/Oxa1 family membrane protein insertase
MDRISRIGVFVCLALLLYLWFATTPPPRPHSAPAAPTVAPAAPAATAPSTPSLSSATPAVPEQLAFLQNAAIKVTFTSLGAAIKEVELLRQKEDRTGNVILNEQAHSNVLQLGGWPGADAVNFQLRQSPNSLVYTGALTNGVAWTRTYTLGETPPPAPKTASSWFSAPFVGLYNLFFGNSSGASAAEYTLTVEDALANPGGAEITLPSYSMSVGRAEPLRVRGHYQPISNMYLGCGWLTPSRFHLTTINDFNPGYFPLIGIKTHDEKDAFVSTSVDPAHLRWLAAENQFFAVLLTPSRDHLIDSARFQCFNSRDATGRLNPPDAEPDIEAAAQFPEVKIPAGQTVALDYTLYTGPKEYHRLNSLGEQQGELMYYDGLLPFSLLIVPMLGILHFFHGLVGNYGLAIILLTLCIKGITWPLQSIANRSGKRMQAVAPKLKELQAKFKEQPEKLNTETFALYREYGVNPFGGCLPALIQMPVFFSLYFMLQNAVELRRQHFLWVQDLTQPDTIATWHMFGMHMALNPLPVMVTGLTMVMMRMTPQIGDPNQAKIAQFMPLIFLFIFYNFAAALSLYYVINNCVSIIQIYRNLRKPLPELKRVPKKKAAPKLS